MKAMQLLQENGVLAKRGKAQEDEGTISQIVDEAN